MGKLPDISNLRLTLKAKSRELLSGEEELTRPLHKLSHQKTVLCISLHNNEAFNNAHLTLLYVL